MKFFNKFLILFTLLAVGSLPAMERTSPAPNKIYISLGAESKLSKEEVQNLKNSYDTLINILQDHLGSSIKIPRLATKPKSFEDGTLMTMDDLKQLKASIEKDREILRPIVMSAKKQAPLQPQTPIKYKQANTFITQGFNDYINSINQDMLLLGFHNGYKGLMSSLIEEFNKIPSHIRHNTTIVDKVGKGSLVLATQLISSLNQDGLLELKKAVELDRTIFTQILATLQRRPSDKIQTYINNYINKIDRALENLQGGKSTTLTGYFEKGSTGRTTPKNEAERVALKTITTNPALGSILTDVTMTDPRWPENQGWVKMKYVAPQSGVEIHYAAKIEYGSIMQVDDFKFKDR